MFFRKFPLLTKLKHNFKHSQTEQGYTQGINKKESKR